MAGPRTWIGRVVDTVRSVLPGPERRSEVPPRPEEGAPRAVDVARPAPPPRAPTVTAPEVTVTAARAGETTLGEWTAALAGVGGLAAQASSNDEDARALVDPAASADAVRRLEDAAFRGLAIVEGAPLSVVWRASEAHFDGARAIGRGALRLRAVRVSWPDDAEAPRVSDEDLGPAAREGAKALAPLGAGEVLVVSLGLSDGDAFVSVEHARHG